MSEDDPTCFIAMPITTHEHEAKLYDDPEHWDHVMEHLFVPAIKAAGYTPIRPAASGTDLIHSRIIQNLEQADFVLCDLSQSNANVFFELGVRTSLNKPIALVSDYKVPLPFDTAGLNTLAYDSGLRPWSMEDQVEALRAHFTASVRTCAGKNPLWERFGLTMRAQTPEVSESPAEAKLDLLSRDLDQMRSVLERYAPPPVSTRRSRIGEATYWDVDADVRLSQRLTQTLSNLGVSARVKIEVTSGGRNVWVHFEDSSLPPNLVIEAISEAAAEFGASSFVTHGGPPPDTLKNVRVQEPK